MSKKNRNIILLGFLITVVLILSAILITPLTKERTYKCYYYTENVNNKDYNILESYLYFNLILNKDGTFIMNFASKERPDEEETLRGNYTETKKALTLCFISSHPEFMAFDCLEFSRSGNKLLCAQSAPLGPLTTTIFLKFKRVLF